MERGTSTGEESSSQPPQQQQQHERQQQQDHHDASSSAAASAGLLYSSTSSLLGPTTTTATTTTTTSMSEQQTSSSTSGGGPRRGNLTREQIRKEEFTLKKIFIRFIFGCCLLSIFSGLIYMGHLYVCGLVTVLEIILFKELVRVRYHTFFATIQDTIPLFRTTQWMWFCVAIFYTYQDFVLDTIQNNQELHYLLPTAQYLPTLSFMHYSLTFVVSIATMQREHIKFQLNQLCWTVVVLCLTVGQLKYIMHNIFNGLFWFVFPVWLVITNDTAAYFCGMFCGRKFVQRPFMPMSPNKTWEGFLGGALCTLVIAWYTSRVLAHYTWMTCPINDFRLAPDKLDCAVDPIFLQAQSILPSQVFELIPRSLAKLIPGVVEICSVKDAVAQQQLLVPASVVLTPCVSGEETHVHHHFEMIIKHIFPIQVHSLWLALFASLVAPFGGFLASAIKRAYGIKDFDSIIPGHGGIMDRMDCQFLMALYTWVHYNSFVRLATISAPKLAYLYSLLTEAEKEEFLSSISAAAVKPRGGGALGGNSNKLLYFGYE